MNLNPLTAAIRAALPIMLWQSMTDAQRTAFIEERKPPHQHHYVTEWRAGADGFAELTGTAICGCGERYTLNTDDVRMVYGGLAEHESKDYPTEDLDKAFERLFKELRIDPGHEVTQ